MRIKSGETVVLSELNRKLLALGGMYRDREAYVAFLEALRGFARNFNQSKMARDCGMTVNTWRNLYHARKNPSFLTMVKMCAGLGLRFRLERDPIPARAAYGSHLPSYTMRCDENGAWDLGE